MAIQVAQIRDRCARRLGSSGTTFETHFVDALNSTISDYNRQCNREIEHKEQADGEIDVDYKHWKTFYLGCLHYLQLSAEWAREPDSSAEAKFERALAMSQFEDYTEDDMESGIPEGDWGSGG